MLRAIGRLVLAAPQTPGEPEQLVCLRQSAEVPGNQKGRADHCNRHDAIEPCGQIERGDQNPSEQSHQHGRNRGLDQCVGASTTDPNSPK